MRTPHSAFYKYSAEAISEANKLPTGTVSEQAHKYGMENGEPLIVAMDCLLKYAEVYRHRFDSNLVDDYVLGDEWLNAIKGIRGLLNGDGVVAMKKEISTDTKDNGCMESMFWSALKLAGYEGKDL